jgi:hypothetical protein
MSRWRFSLTNSSGGSNPSSSVTTSDTENFKVDFGGKISETSDKRIFKSPTDIIIVNPGTL